MPDILSVTDRSVVEVKGKDTLKFLQALCTSDLSELPNPVRVTAFLSPKGRVISECFLYGRRDLDSGEDSVLIETASEGAVQLLQSLKLYKLRSKVKIAAVQDTEVVLLRPQKGGAAQAEATTPEMLAASASLSGDIMAAAWDPRVPDFGVRVIMEVGDGSGHATDSSGDEYTSYRIARGIAEGAELANMIPLECNMDLLSHVDFRKGCYVGQELVARTKFKGVVRKRVVPFVCIGDERPRGAMDFVRDEKSDKDEHRAVTKAVVGDKVHNVDGKASGSIISLSSDRTSGLALVRLATITGDGGAALSAGDDVLVPFRPLWWPDVDPITEKPLY